MEKKDVLFLCQFFYPEYISSATLPFDTAKALNDSGKTVGVLCGYPKEYSSKENVSLKENYEGIEIERVKYVQLKRSNVVGRLINYFSFTLSILMRINKLKQYKIVIVYSNPPILTLITSIANALFGVKIIFVSYDLYPEIALQTNTLRKNSVIHKFMNFLNEKSFPRFKAVVALSNEMKEFIVNHRKNIRDEQIVVIPNWFEDIQIDEKSIELANNNEKLKEIVANKKIVISYFGNMGIAQDMETLYETIKSNAYNSDYHFLVAGHGSKKEELEKFIKDNSLKNVSLFNFLGDKDYQDALAISDALVVSLEEGLDGLCVPSKVYGYYSSGKPVIAILSPKMDISKEISSYNNGFVIKNKDISAFNNVLSLLKNKQVNKEMGRKSKILFEEKYTRQKSTDKYIDLVNSVLEEENLCLKTERY